MKMLFRSSVVLVSESYGGMERWRAKLHIILRIPCTKARPNGGWAGLPCYNPAAIDIPAEGICNYVPLFMHHSNWLAAGSMILLLLA